MYPTTSTPTAYAYNQHITKPLKKKIYTFTFEVRPQLAINQDSFQPKEPALTTIKEKATSGLLSMLSQSVCLLPIFGSISPFRARSLQELQNFRDEVLAKSKAGQKWVELVERHREEVSLLILEGEANFKQLSVLVKEARFDQRFDPQERLKQAISVCEPVSSALAKCNCSSELKKDIKLMQKMLTQLGECSAQEAAAFLLRKTPQQFTKKPSKK